MIRLYFNNWNDPAGCWSWDTGPGTPERKVWYVEVPQGSTREDMKNRGSKTSPSAWIEFTEVEAEQIEDTLVIKKNRATKKR